MWSKTVRQSSSAANMYTVKPCEVILNRYYINRAAGHSRTALIFDRAGQRHRLLLITQKKQNKNRRKKKHQPSVRYVCARVCSVDRSNRPTSAAALATPFFLVEYFKQENNSVGTPSRSSFPAPLHSSLSRPTSKRAAACCMGRYGCSSTGITLSARLTARVWSCSDDFVHASSVKGCLSSRSKHRAYCCRSSVRCARQK